MILAIKCLNRWKREDKNEEQAMRKNRVHLSPEADLDLLEIEEYGEVNWGTKQKRKYLKSLYEAFEDIASFPEFFGMAHKDLDSQCRSRVEGKHRIFYLIGDDYIEIVRVLRQEADYVRHL